MSILDELIPEIQRQSALPPGSAIYEETFQELMDLGLNLAFFVFETGDKSHFARQLDDGHTETFPVLTIYLKYDEDYRKTGIDENRGNWGDDWAQTIPVRKIVNAKLAQYGFGGNHISDRTFIFVGSLERIAFLQIGKLCKTELSNLVCHYAPDVHVPEVFWNSERQFHVIMENKKDCDRVNAEAKANILKELQSVLKKADVIGYCQNYDVQLEIGFPGDRRLNYFLIDREDI